MDYYSGTKREILPFAIARMDPRALCCEISQTENDLTHMWNLKNKQKTHEYRAQTGGCQAGKNLGEEWVKVV